jgi:hypothetical protein
LGFLRLCGGQCVGADDGGTEQGKSVAQGISRYVVNKVVHHDQTVRSITVGVKRYRTKTEAHAYLYLSDRSSI